MIGKRRRSNSGNTWVYRRAHGRKINDRCRYDREARWLEKKKGKNSSRVLLRENWQIDRQIRRKKGSVART